MSAALSLGLPITALPPGSRLKNDLDLRRVWPSFLVWLAVSICTLGLGWIIVSGHFFKTIIDTTYVVDGSGRRVARLRSDYDVEAHLRHVLLWAVLSFATLGIGLLFYSFHAARSALDATVLEAM
jgi:hypothetical protein